MSEKQTTGNIFLIGPMGVGKTTVGRQLAFYLKREFKDSDHEIEARTGVDIPLIFSVEGEAGFRKRECAIIDTLSQSNQLVLATGGGAVLNADNRVHLQNRGHVVYLYASVEQLIKRTRNSKNRPLLQTENPAKKLAEIMSERKHLYESIADLSIETGKWTVRNVVNHIGKWLESREH
jgi:shikimate kinase